MIRAFKIKNHLGDSVLIDIRRPENTGFLISSVTGLDPVKANISQSEITMIDGSLISGVKLEPRNIVFNIIFYSDNNEKLSIEYIRHKSYTYFPLKKEIEITVTNDYGDFVIHGVVETNEIPVFTKTEGAQISVICPDPYFEKLGDDNLHYISRVVPNFSFPVSFEAIMEEVPPEEDQPGLRYIVDDEGNTYYEYFGPFSVTSRAFNEQILKTSRKFMDNDITVNEIPYEEEINETGGTTVKIGD